MTDTQLLRPPGRPVTRAFGRDQSQQTSWHDTRKPGLATVLVWVATGLAVGVGVALRAWYVFHQPINADEAVVGLMAMQILHGHFSAFYWGQVYGGGEPYLVAVAFGIFGTSVWALEAVSIVLSAAAAVISWRITRRLVSDPALAVLAGALIWAAPEAAIWNSTIELGFRGVTMVCGLGLLLVSLRLLDGRRSLLEFAAFGLLAGIGWWSSPEIVYFAIPAGLLMVGAIIRDPEPEVGRLARWAARLTLALIAGVVGALPWLWANVNSGFYSLNTSAFATPPQATGYSGRLGLFCRYGMPMLFNLRTEETQQLVLGRDWSLLALIALLVVVAVALVLCILRGGRSLILAGAVVVFPFILALSPATWFEKDGRYADFVFPLLVFVLVIGATEATQRLTRYRRRPLRQETSMARVLLGGLVVVVVLLGVFNFATYESYVYPTASFGSDWTNPDAPTLQAISDLEVAGVHYGYADYWVAYRLDFLSKGQLGITTAGTDPDRWEALDRQVRTSRSTAWLFVNPDALAIEQFAKSSYVQGPDGLSEAQFLAELRRLDVSYRTINTGLVRAIIPKRAVLPNEVGR